VTETYRIGPLVLDSETGVVTHAGVPVPLGKRAVAVLSVLVRSAPQYVAKTRIMEAAWPGVIVEEGNLAVQISSIRRALADVSGGAAWLETLAGRGYRFVGPVASLATGTAQAADKALHSNLPESVTSFVGRERELAEVSELLESHRLLTLTGTGGVGKTRLAMRAAAAKLADYRDGVWLVELAALRDPDLVPQAAIAAIGLKEQPGKRLTQSLTEHLQPRHALLILDNAEHLIAACAELADAIVRHCPNVTIVVTSRERLGVPGEVTYRVPSLSVPDPTSVATAHDVLDYESVRLFRERARLHVPHFTVTNENTPAVANICRRLGGIALAIELAAARVRSMSVHDIDQRLDKRFELLTGGSRTLPPRQQTLRAAIDWSFDLLSETEKALFCAISVFVGGFTLEAAERVCTGETLQAGEVLDVLSSLVDKSLVAVEERDATTRYQLPDTMHEYATERSRAMFHDLPWHERHRDHFFALALQAEPQLKGADQQAWLDRLETEHDNLRAALARSTRSVEGETGLRLANALARFWLVRGYLAEARGWLSRLLAASPDAEAATRAKALNWIGIFSWKQGDYAAAQAAYERSLAMRRELGDRQGVGAVLNNLGLLAYEHGDYRSARALHEESLAVDRELGDRWGVAVSLIHLASLALMQGDHASARALNEESLALFRAFGDRGHTANALRSLGTLSSHEGDQASARALFEEALAICRQLGDRSGIAGALYGLGVAARHAGDASTARELLDESLAIFRELGDREGMAKAMSNLGQVAAAQGDYPAARSLQQEGLAIYRELSDRSGIAGLIEGLAGTAFALGEPVRAACLWGAMERLREDIAAPMAPSERPHYDRIVADARAAIDDAAAFDLAWQRGRAMTLDQAIAYALGDRVPSGSG
jgi:non-specific serine/threonine protein kinase